MKFIIHEQQMDTFVRRRFSLSDLNDLVREVKDLVGTYDDTEAAMYDAVREFIKDGNFIDIDEHGLVKESQNEYIIYGESDHIMNKGFYFNTSDDEYVLIPKNLGYRRRLSEYNIQIKIYHDRKKAEEALKKLKKGDISNIRWYIKSL